MAMPSKVRISFAILLLIAVVAIVFVLNRPASASSTQSTDDAYVQADFTRVAPRVSGTIKRVLVQDNQQVKAGQLLAEIDDRDFVVALKGAKANVAHAEADLARIKAQLAQQHAVIRQAQATLQADRADLALAKQDQTRYANLAKDGSGTVQASQRAHSHLLETQAATARDAAALQATQTQTQVLKASVAQAEASLEQAQAAQDAAQLALSYTRIVAPVAGTVGQRELRVGAFAQVAKPLLAIVPLDAVYVEAHFRETQLARVKAGDPVRIDVDALPGVTLTGKVDSLGPASGASFSAIAPHDATGNFTKVVQRLPVRIRFEPGQQALSRLRVGMSVVPQIEVR